MRRGRGIALFGLLGIATSAYAGEPRAALHAVSLGAYLDLTARPEADPDGGERTKGWARIIPKGEWEIGRLASVMAQLEASPAGGRILDAVMQGELAPGLAARVGKFKTPISREVQESIRELRFVERAVVVNHVPMRRIGVDLAYVGALGSAASGRVQAGIFEGPTLESALGVVSAGIRWTGGLELHGAFAGSLGAGARAGAEVDPTVADLALTFRRKGARLLAEAAVSATPEGWTQAASVEGAYSAEEGSMTFEPTLRFDLRAFPGDPLHPRVVPGLNLYFLNGHLVQVTDLVIEPRPDQRLVTSLLFQTRARF